MEKPGTGRATRKRGEAHLFRIRLGRGERRGKKPWEPGGWGPPATVASNVKHQRARATASRVNGTISLRALRCMR